MMGFMPTKVMPPPFLFNDGGKSCFYAKGVGAAVIFLSVEKKTFMQKFFLPRAFSEI